MTPEAQHAPWTSSTGGAVCFAFAGAQQSPDTVNTDAAEQHAPLLDVGPVHPGDTSQYWPVYPAAHTQLSLPQLPWCEHAVAAQNAHVEHTCVASGTVSPALTHASAATGNDPELLVATHVTGRSAVPPQSFVQAPQSPRLKPYVVHGPVLQLRDVAGL